MQKIISIKDGVARMPEWRMAEPVNFEALDGEQIAIVGPNGGGKSMFADIIVGRHPLLMRDPEYDFAPSTKPLAADNIKYITFRDSYGDNNDGTYYLQQRWNQMEIDKETPIVRDVLANCTDEIIELLHLEHLLDKYVILLSSGELRKLKLAKTLITEPRVMIIDNPFIGLDEETRGQLKTLLNTIIQKRALQIILILSKYDDIPEFITHVVEVRDMKVGTKQTREEFLKNYAKIPDCVLPDSDREAILRLCQHDNDYNANEVIKMNNVTIRYGERVILQGLDWSVKNGECWAVSGQNGAGKSTLLSLVCADNPQSYACDIELFEHKRGSGESIWDIKKHIGYVSPEMHRSYHRDIPAIRIVASGLKDSVGLYVKPNDKEYEMCRWWMNLFGLKGKENVSFMKLSSGEQRLVLLARAFVKDPELLILDEPLHGLDNYNRQMVKDIINTFSLRRNKTIIMVTHYKEEMPKCITNFLYLKRHV